MVVAVGVVVVVVDKRTLPRRYAAVCQGSTAGCVLGGPMAGRCKLIQNSFRPTARLPEEAAVRSGFPTHVLYEKGFRVEKKKTKKKGGFTLPDS